MYMTSFFPAPDTKSRRTTEVAFDATEKCNLTFTSSANHTAIGEPEALLTILFALQDLAPWFCLYTFLNVLCVTCGVSLSTSSDACFVSVQNSSGSGRVFLFFPAPRDSVHVSGHRAKVLFWRGLINCVSIHFGLYTGSLF